MRFTVLLNVVLLALWSPSAGYSHEFWIAPQKYQVETGKDIAAHFVNGQNFRGGTLAWFNNRVARADVRLGNSTRKLSGRSGDIPAIRTEVQGEGLVTLAVETPFTSLTYREEEKFADFVNHKDLKVDPAAQLYPLKEAYSRHAKALIKLGHGRGSDAAMGLEVEFVALENPYTDNVSDGMDVQLFYKNKPRANAQVEVYELNSKNGLDLVVYRTDSKGKATIKVRPGHRYLVDSVVLRDPSAETLKRFTGRTKIAYETLWAALTFEVPQ